jgi:hypothetical protein
MHIKIAMYTSILSEISHNPYLTEDQYRDIRTGKLKGLLQFNKLGLQPIWHSAEEIIAMKVKSRYPAVYGVPARVLLYNKAYYG